MGSPTRPHRRRAAALLAVAVVMSGCGSATPVTTTATTVVATTAAPTTTTTAVPTTTTTTKTTTAIPAGDVIAVPEGTAPTIDGTLDEEAWKDAVTTEAGDGMTLLWLAADGVLYVGVRYDKMGAVNLLIAEGERVRILHSSAALGSATHVWDGTTWNLASDYAWCCRNPASTSQRNALWEEEGWVSVLSGVGAVGEVEYAVAGADGAHVAVSWVAPGNDTILWPDDLPEAEAAALTGPRLPESTFDPESWPRVQFDG